MFLSPHSFLLSPFSSGLISNCLLLSHFTSSHVLHSLLISFCLFTSHLAASLLILSHYYVCSCLILYSLLLLHLLASSLLISFYIVSYRARERTIYKSAETSTLVRVQTIGDGVVSRVLPPLHTPYPTSAHRTNGHTYITLLRVSINRRRR